MSDEIIRVVIAIPNEPSLLGAPLSARALSHFANGIRLHWLEDEQQLVYQGPKSEYPFMKPSAQKPEELTTIISRYQAQYGGAWYPSIDTLLLLEVITGKKL